MNIPSQLNDFIAIQLHRKFYSCPWNIPGWSPHSSARQRCGAAVCTLWQPLGSSTVHAHSCLTISLFLFEPAGLKSQFVGGWLLPVCAGTWCSFIIYNIGCYNDQFWINCKIEKCHLYTLQLVPI